MIRLLLLCLSICSIQIILAQGPSAGFGNPSNQITGKVVGTVLDTISNQPVEFATVVIRNIATQKEQGGMITDENGNFKFINLPLGHYEIAISFLGYAPKSFQVNKLTEKNPDLDLGSVFIHPEGVNLNTITVTEEASLIENQIDKIVFNADKDVTSVGGDAADVLRKVPLLTVDIEGNVSLRGSSNIQILINGKQSSIFSSDVANALKTLPADQIKKVEVITSPSAKYDGEGSAGIINIITKKKNLEGFTGSVSTTVGTRTNRGNFNLALGRGRFGLNANVGTFYGWPREGNFDFYREDVIEGQKSVLDQSGPSKTSVYGPGGTIGAFYDINGFNSINSSLSFRGFGNTADGETTASFVNPLASINQNYIRLYDTRTLRGSFDWTNDYRRTFKNPDQELILALQFSGSKSNNDSEIQQSGNDETLFRNERNENDGLNLESTIQLDYVHPFNESVKLETGLKTILREIDSDYLYENFDPDLNVFLIDDQRTNAFYYDQNVYAGYASFNIKLGEHYGMVAGLRYEYTDIKGNLESGENGFANDYNNLLPSIIFNRKFGQSTNVKISFNRRIQRPSLQFINPYVEITDDRNISFGNPQLGPELSDQVELGYSTFFKGIVVNAAIYYKQTTDLIENYLQITDYTFAGDTLNNASVTTYQNLGDNQSVGLNFFTSANLFNRKLNLRGNFNLFTYDAAGQVNGVDISRSALLFNCFGSATFSFKKGFKAEVFGFYRSPQQSLQGERASFTILSIGFKKEFANKRVSLGLSIIEPFHKHKSFPNELEGENFVQRSNFTIPFRSFGLSFDYRFGKLNFNQRSRKSSINNDDVKSQEGRQY